MKLLFIISLPALTLVIGCRPSVAVEGNAVASGQSSSGVTSGGAGGAAAATTTAGSGGAPSSVAASSGASSGGAPGSASTASSSGGGGDPELATSASAGAGGGAAVLGTTASSSGVGGSPSPGSSAASTGSGGSGGSGGITLVTCPLCSDAINDFVAPEVLCLASQTKYLAVVKCACVDTCASVCGVPDAVDCLAVWQGKAPPECAACLASANGCLTAWDACVGDDGVSNTVGLPDARP